MTNSAAPVSALPKGHIRCFNCSKTCQRNLGSWHENAHRQVFLCKACEPSAIVSQTSKLIPNPMLKRSFD